MQFVSDNPARDLFAAVNLLLFLVLGAWLLHRRLTRRIEYSMGTQVLVLLWALLACGMEMAALRGLQRMSPVHHIFAVLGLFTATVALYGHFFLSLASRLLVDLVMSPNDPAEDRVRMGNAEAEERRGDYAAAHREYLVLSRIHPASLEIHTRMAENLLRLGRADEAAACLEKALSLALSPRSALIVFWRLAGLLEQSGAPPERFQGLVRRFCNAFPGSGEAATVNQWLKEAVGCDAMAQPLSILESELASLEDHPIDAANSRDKHF